MCQPGIEPEVLNNMEEIIVTLGIIILFSLALWRVYIFVRYFWRITKRK